jgi:hypothetical protein
LQKTGCRSCLVIALLQCPSKLPKLPWPLRRRLAAGRVSNS